MADDIRLNNGDHGAWHLADNPAEYQPARAANFKFVVQGLDKLLKVGGDANDESDYISGAQKVLSFSVYKFDAPHFTQEEVSVERENSKIYFAGKPTWKEGTLGVYDFVGAGSKSILEAWQGLSYERDSDGIPSSNKYKVNCQVIEYLPDHTFVKYWDLEGCWIKGLNETGYDWTSGDKKVIDATLRYDRAIPRYTL